MSLHIDVQWHAPRRGQERGTHRAFELNVACAMDQPVTGVFGPSGSGKTTLLSLIAGLLRPSRGRIACDETTLFDQAAGIDVPTHRRGIAVVFQDGRLFPHLSVRRNLHYGMRRHGGNGPDEASVTGMLGLEPLLHRRVHTLSGGERQRVALGRALLSAPRLLLLDEPLASLDVAMKRQVLPMLRRVAAESGTPIMYVSHDIGEILQLTHELVIIHGGRCIGQGPLHRVVKDPEVFTLAAGTGLENVLRARIDEQLPASGLTRLHILHEDGSGAATLLGPPLDRPVGGDVLIAIRPEDVAISLAPVEGISIQNQIQATIVRTSEVAGRGLLELDVGGPFLVEVSLRSITSLDLTPGRGVVCLLKAHAIRYLDA